MGQFLFSSINHWPEGSITFFEGIVLDVYFDVFVLKYLFGGWVFLLHVCLGTTCMPGACKVSKRVSLVIVFHRVFFKDKASTGLKLLHRFSFVI